MQLLEIVTQKISKGVIQKIPEEAVLFEYRIFFSFRNTCSRSKCGVCTLPYQLGTVLEASLFLFIENVTVLRSPVWISLSSLIDPTAFFVYRSKD